jgi:hypothetical protein
MERKAREARKERRVLAACASFAFLVFLLFSAPAGAQGTQPPIQGVTGTVATEGSRDGVKKAAGAAARGVKKILPGGSGESQNPMDVLIEGSHVTVTEGAAPDSSAEGIVVDVNKKRQQITVRFADKTTQTLRVLNHAGSNPGPHVLVALADQAEKVSYDFSRVP